MNEEIVVAEFKKNARDVVRVSIKTWQGRRLFDLRVYYRKDEQWLPGSRGLCLFAPVSDCPVSAGGDCPV